MTITEAGNNLQKNFYDARNFRTEVLTYYAGVLSETRHCYFTSNWRNIEERVDTGTTAERQFVWGVRYIDDLVLRDRSSERLYTMQDANWSMNAVTTPAGVVGERYAYSTYGKTTFLSPSYEPRFVSSSAWETLYCGYRSDTGTALLCVRYRFLNSAFGVWCSRDPKQYVDSSNLAQYVRSRPVTAFDPFGLLDFNKPLDERLATCDSTLAAKVRAQKDRGCIGYVCAELGIPDDSTLGNSRFYKPGGSNFAATMCFKDLNLAINRQKEINNQGTCPGNACSGTKAKSRVVEIQFATWDGPVNALIKFVPQPTRKGGNEYNLENNSGMPLVAGKIPPFWEVVHCGGPGYFPTGNDRGNGNFDLAILMNDGTWLHGSRAGEPPKMSTKQQMNDQYETLSEGDYPGSQGQGFWFNARFWCVVCETPWENGKPTRKTK
jgi:RHS repeat-associated protein